MTPAPRTLGRLFFRLISNGALAFRPPKRICRAQTVKQRRC